MSLDENSSAQGAKDFLVEKELVQQLAIMIAALNEAVVLIGRGSAASSSIGGNYYFLVFAHICMWLNENEMANEFVEIANKEFVREISTPFWNEYATALGSLFEGSNCEPQRMKLEGQEKYWKCYLELMAAYTSGADNLGDLIEAAKSSFTKRNNDNSIKDDLHRIEGSGLDRLKVDFRLESLLEFMSIADGGSRADG